MKLKPTNSQTKSFIDISCIFWSKKNFGADLNIHRHVSIGNCFLFNKKNTQNSKRAAARIKRDACRALQSSICHS